MIHRTLALALLTSAFLCACGTDEPVVTTTPETTTSVVYPGTYAAWLRLEPGGVRDGSIVPVFRPAPDAPTLEQRARTLLAGYTFSEAGFGIGTAIPFDVELLGVTGPVDGVAIVDLSAPFAEGSGLVEMEMRLAQMVFTLTEDPSVDRVSFSIEGTPVSEFSAERIDVSAPLRRSDFANHLERVNLDSPRFLQDDLASTIQLRGVADAEVVSFEIVDPDGEVLASGSVSTEDAGDPTGLRSFEAEVDIASPAPGALCLIHLWVDAPRQELSVPVYAAG